MIKNLNPQTLEEDANGVPYEIETIGSTTIISLVPSDPPAPTLDDIKQAKIVEVTQAYQAELNSTFTSSATGSALVYDYSPNSQELWKELLDSINAGYIPDTSFPLSITLADKSMVPHTKAQLQQIGGEITLRKLQLYGKLQAMTVVGGSILSATEIADVEKISW